jgi:uroporphyrinogen decarboxylase
MTYKEWGLPYTQRVASAIKKTGARLMLHICGNTSDRLEMLAATGVEGLSLDAKVDFGHAREVLGPNYLLMGNVEPTSPLTFGTPEEVYLETKKVIEQAGKEGHFFVSGGCLISEHAPEENMEAMLKAAYETVY